MAIPTITAAPNTTYQRIRSAPHEWHVQITGEGPDLLLLHGAGGSATGWNRLLPALPGYRLIAPDLPGQGRSRTGAPRFGLEAMATDLATLIRGAGWSPRILLGHSAGAAIALDLGARHLDPPPRLVVGINAALSPFQGVAGWLFPRLARAMTLSPFLSHMLARMAGTPEHVARLIRSTGSRPDPGIISDYRALMSDPAHVAGTLNMMAAWNLAPLLTRLESIELPVLLVAGARDRAVPCEVSRRAAARLARGSYAELPGLGHLAHEENADSVALLIRNWLAAQENEARSSPDPAVSSPMAGNKTAGDGCRSDSGHRAENLTAVLRKIDP